MLHWFKKRIDQTSWSAGAYQIRDRIVIHSISRTHNNVGWYNQPVFALSANASAIEVGTKLREALNASTWDSRDDDSRQRRHPILREAGAGSFRELDDHSKFVSVDSDKRTVTVIPSRWATSGQGGRGFEGDLERKIDVDWDCSVALGRALLAALAYSTGNPLE